MRRQFQLPSYDVEFLDDLGLDWETLNDKGMQWVIIYNYPVAPGYTQNNVDIALKIETGYPRVQIDMAYFYPALVRKDKKLIKATSNQTIDEKIYQRWSRHRTAQNPWREGVDDISTHITLVSFWFEQEFIKQPYGITS
ncbi:MAG: hypothetical protein KQH79_01120 [Bacteroidetes bacterium]|nr:hypothetical protein [Bacteroidota bacterium]